MGLFDNDALFGPDSYWSAIAPWIPYNSQAQPYNPIPMTPQERASDAASASWLKANTRRGNIGALGLANAPGISRDSDLSPVMAPPGTGIPLDGPTQATPGAADMSAIPKAAPGATLSVPGMPTPSAVKSGYSLPDLVGLAQGAGFTEDKAPLAAAIMMAESSGNPYAKNEKGEHSYGLSQINADAHGPIAETALGNPDQAAKLMFDISKGGTDFSPWSAYKNGQYKQYLDKNMLPAFGNARALASLMPASSSPGAAAAPDPTDPTSVAATGGLYDGPAVGGGVTGPSTPTDDPMATMKALLSSASANGLGFNLSKALANMSAGFLGGKGPAAALAGGFGGFAKSQQEDATELNKLVQMSMLYGPIQQQKVEQQKMSAAAALTRTGQVGMGTALRMQGLDPMKYLGKSEDEANASTFSEKPLPAQSQKQVDTHLAGVGAIREQKAILSQLQDHVKDGTFVPDAPHMKSCTRQRLL
jgi:hypothetical protein